jgi:ferric-dicitrate binding protein FerR (iron transport regulator)
MTCEKYEKLIEQYVDGTISDEQLAELKTHAEECASCREEFDGCVLLEDVVRQAFSSRTSAEQARSSVVARVSAGPSSPAQRTRYGAGWLGGKRAAIAASILLAVGLSLGFAMGRAGIFKRPEAPLTAQVPIRIGGLEGTVLVMHKGSDLWQVLEAGSNVYLGDTFHSTAKSAFVLELEDESTIEVNQNSMLVLKLYNGETQFFLEYGRCTAALESPHPPFFIYTPHGRVEALGTEFTITVE